MSELASYLWSLRRAGTAVATLARAVGFRVPSPPSLPPSPSGLSAQVAPGVSGSLSDYLDAVAATYGLESEPVLLRLGQIDDFLRHAAPFVLALSAPSEGLLLVAKSGPRYLWVVSPDGGLQKLATAVVAEALAAPALAPLQPEVERLLSKAGIQSPSRRAALTRTILQRRFGDTALRGAYLLRLSAARPLPELAREAELPRLLSFYGLAHATQYVLGLLLFYLVGDSALSGRLDRAWLWAGGLLMMSMPPLLLVESWLLGRIAIVVGIVLRRRLLLGAVKLPLDAARQSGYGDFVCQIIESEVVELGLRSGGVAAAAALIDLLGAIPILLLASTGTVLTLLCGIVLTVLLTYGMYHARLRWTEARFRLVGDLLEKMLGHRTRLVQEPRTLRHRGEDEGLAEYHGYGRTLDAWSAALLGILPSAFLVAGFASLLPLWRSIEAKPGLLAVAFGGVTLGYRALSRLAGGLSQLAGVVIALRRCRHLLQSAAAPEFQPLTAASPTFAPGEVVLEAKRLTVRYARSSGLPALRDLSLKIRAGQRLLLQGPSGSGKSTLASALTGLLPIESGQVLLGGLDLSALGGRRWRQLVATAPQFHENHILSGSLAFNLLMGRRWPAIDADLADARALCEELGLGDLLARMPLGLDQQVGETGWQLSHGEKSRIFMARALLQNAPLTILDESFAALDPETIARCLDCVLRRSDSLMVIAHP
jgi:ATP-binding cassette subfamily B protein